MHAAGSATVAAASQPHRSRPLGPKGKRLGGSSRVRGDLGGPRGLLSKNLGPRKPRAVSALVALPARRRYRHDGALDMRRFRHGDQRGDHG